MQLKLTNFKKASSNMWSIISFSVSVSGSGILTAIVKISLLTCFVYNLISFYSINIEGI